ncbi:hypothetical protein SC10_B2orf03458 [Bacillus paralicheniformis]|nr:hypothetical protein SC10_B2orf03458 [Bacillus paralicheniformis]
MSALLDLMIWIERKITDLHHYEAAGNLYTGFKERGEDREQRYLDFCLIVWHSTIQ